MTNCKFKTTILKIKLETPKIFTFTLKFILFFKRFQKKNIYVCMCANIYNYEKFYVI